MPSNTVLISGPAVGTAQILIWPYSCMLLPPVSMAIRTSEFSPVGALSGLWHIPQTQSLPSWSCGFNLQLVQLVGRFWVIFLGPTAPGFNCFPPLHMGHSLGFAPVQTRYGDGAAPCVTGFPAAPVTQGSWLLGQDFPGDSDGKASIYNAGDLGLIPGLGRFHGEGNGNPLQYCCLENPMDGRAWCRLLSMGSQRVGHDWETSLSLSEGVAISISQYAPVFLLGDSPPWQRSLAGHSLQGCKVSDTTEAALCA